jgi:hypothetical protein
MKQPQFIPAILLAATLVAVSFTSRADDPKPKPYAPARLADWLSTLSRSFIMP